MEESGEGEDSIEGELPSLMKEAPDIAAHQLEVRQLTSLIHEKEAYLRSLSSKPTVHLEEKHGTLVAKLEHLKNIIEEKQKTKQSIEKSLKEVNQQLQKKAEMCGKLQVTLRYRDEQRTNEAIKRLEKHLNTHTLKSSEEKKIVKEIDSLKRSKKNLSAFVCVKHEVDQLRYHQGQMRTQRDHLFCEIGELKGREMKVKMSLESTVKEEETAKDDIDEANKEVNREEIKKEVDELYKQRRECQVRFKQDLMHYEQEQKALKHVRNEQERREERRLWRFHNTVVDDSGAHCLQETQPAAEEQMICDGLIQFLLPFKVDNGGESSDKIVSSSETSHKTHNNSHNMTVLVKHYDEDMQGIFASSKKKTGGKKRNRKACKTKYNSQKLVLHPKVLGQFLKLKIEPPSTYADVNKTIEKLRCKKDLFLQEVTNESQVIPVQSTTPTNKEDSCSDESMVNFQKIEETHGVLVNKDSMLPDNKVEPSHQSRKINLNQSDTRMESPYELPRNIGDHGYMKDINDNDCSNEAIKCFKLTSEEQIENKTMFQENMHGTSPAGIITHVCSLETNVISETLDKLSVG